MLPPDVVSRRRWNLVISRVPAVLLDPSRTQLAGRLL
jgi:hypothetical protein